MSRKPIILNGLNSPFKKIDPWVKKTKRNFHLHAVSKRHL